MAIFDLMWDAYGDFRAGMYVTSYLWAAVFLIQSVGTVLIIRETSYSTGYNYDQILPVVAIALELAGSVAIGRHFTDKGRARGAAADLAPPEFT